MTVRYNYVFAIPESDETFDEMVRDACAIEWGDPETQLNGRSGQSQNGVDVFGYPYGPGGRCRAAQSKLRAKGKSLTKTEIDEEVEKARSSPLKPEQLIIATSTGRDANLQAHVDQISHAQTQSKSFSVKIWFWEDLLDRLLVDRQHFIKYFKDLFASITNLEEAKALIDKPIFVLIETCGGNSDGPNMIEEALRMRGVSTCRDGNAVTANLYRPDGVICFYPCVAEISDDLAMQRFVTIVRRHESGNAPVFAIVPPEFDTKFCEFYQRENGKLDQVSILRMDQPATQIVKLIFSSLLTHGYRRRAALSVIDISFRSMSALPKSALLDLDWTPHFKKNEAWPAQDLWYAIYLPAIQDVVDGLASLGSNVRLQYDVKLLLPVALALGFYSNIRLCKASVWVRQANGSPFTARFWNSDAAPAPIIVQEQDIVQTVGQSKNLIVEISSQADIHLDVQAYVEEESFHYGKWLKIDLVEHSRQGIPLEASYATAYADQVGRIIRNQKGGYSDIHLFISTPSPLAFLIGQRLQACGRVHLYWYLSPSYREAFVLQ